jgi:hypothetical protein
MPKTCLVMRVSRHGGRRCEREKIRSSRIPPTKVHPLVRGPNMDPSITAAGDSHDTTATATGRGTR